MLHLPRGYTKDLLNKQIITGLEPWLLKEIDDLSIMFWESKITNRNRWLISFPVFGNKIFVYVKEKRFMVIFTGKKSQITYSNVTLYL